MEATDATRRIVRPPAETQYAEELHALAANDRHPRPPGWRLSPRAARAFILGSDGAALQHEWDGRQTRTVVTAKFYGDDALVERAIVTLACNRGLILVGVSGKSHGML